MCSLQEHIEREKRAREQEAADSEESTIPDEAVEAAARILFQTSPKRFIEPFERALELCKADVRPILEAAAPYMLREAQADAWIDGAVSVMVKHEIASHDAKNPFRS